MQEYAILADRNIIDIVWLIWSCLLYCNSRTIMQAFEICFNSNWNGSGMIPICWSQVWLTGFICNRCPKSERRATVPMPHSHPERKNRPWSGPDNPSSYGPISRVRAATHPRARGGEPDPGQWMNGPPTCIRQPAAGSLNHQPHAEQFRSQISG